MLNPDNEYRSPTFYGGEPVQQTGGEKPIHRIFVAGASEAQLAFIRKTLAERADFEFTVEHAEAEEVAKRQTYVSPHPSDMRRILTGGGVRLSDEQGMLSRESQRRFKAAMAKMAILAASLPASAGQDDFTRHPSARKFSEVAPNKPWYRQGKRNKY